MKILRLHYPEERVKLPQEDAWAIDDKHFAFAVADGVHLFPGIEYKRGRNYPTPSPAGRLAREFCGNFIKFQKRATVARAFARANRSVFYLNKDRKKSKTFLTAEAYYAATAVVGRITGRTLEWRGVCDSSVTVLDRNGKILLSRTDHAHHNEFDPLLAPYFHIDQSYMLRTIFRNAISPTGGKLGYGVITGEPSAERYAWFGKKTLQKGDLVVFATDGFEKYISMPAFRKALLTMNRPKIEDAMDRIKLAHKNDHGYISEKTLIAARVG